MPAKDDTMNDSVNLTESAGESLTGDALQVFNQCRAVAHMARALAEVHDARAVILRHNPDLEEVIGSGTAELMELLGDALSNMDAVGHEEDGWLDEVFEKAHARWPAPASLSAPALQIDQP